MPSKSFYAITRACGTCNLFCKSALPRNRASYICCPKCDAFVELLVCCGSAARSSSGPLILEVCRSHTAAHRIRYDSSGWVIGTSHSRLLENRKQSQLTFIYPTGFEPTISADWQPQTYGLHRAATGPEFIELTRLNHKERKKHTKTHSAMKKVASPRLERKYIAFLT